MSSVLQFDHQGENSKLLSLNVYNISYVRKLLVKYEIFSQAGSSCEECEEPCLKARPEGCVHPCVKPCHPGSCPRCLQTVKCRCHCGLNWAYYKCGEWISSKGLAREKMKSCSDQCPKLVGLFSFLGRLR